MRTDVSTTVEEHLEDSFYFPNFNHRLSFSSPGWIYFSVSCSLDAVGGESLPQEAKQPCLTVGYFIYSTGKSYRVQWMQGNRTYYLINGSACVQPGSAQRLPFSAPISICLSFCNCNLPLSCLLTLNPMTFTGVGGQTPVSHAFLHILRFIPLSPAQSPPRSSPLIVPGLCLNAALSSLFLSVRSVRR